jgi:hypothetical protein
MARDINDVIKNLPASRRRKIEKRAASIANLSQGEGTTGDEVSDETKRSARERSSDNQLAADLGALGYPGFRYLSGEPRDPAEVLLDALDRDNLDARVYGNEKARSTTGRSCVCKHHGGLEHTGSGCSSPAWRCTAGDLPLSQRECRGSSPICDESANWPKRFRIEVS